MDGIKYDEAKMMAVRERVKDLSNIVNELEADFPGRKFTLDGHLVGSIGEVMAAYYYGIELYRASTERHDGIVNGREIQVKITQGDRIIMSDEPDYLIVLYLRHDGEIFEIYNGKGNWPWRFASNPTKRNVKHITTSKLMKLDADVLDEDRIKPIHPIEKMKREYRHQVWK